MTNTSLVEAHHGYSILRSGIPHFVLPDCPGCQMFFLFVQNEFTGARLQRCCLAYISKNQMSRKSLTTQSQMKTEISCSSSSADILSSFKCSTWMETRWPTRWPEHLANRVRVFPQPVSDCVRFFFSVLYHPWEGCQALCSPVRVLRQLRQPFYLCSVMSFITAT